jgi:hypothetical protein
VENISSVELRTNPAVYSFAAWNLIRNLRDEWSLYPWLFELNNIRQHIIKRHKMEVYKGHMRLRGTCLEESRSQCFSINCGEYIQCGIKNQSSSLLLCGLKLDKKFEGWMNWTWNHIRGEEDLTCVCEWSGNVKGHGYGLYVIIHISPDINL